MANGYKIYSGDYAKDGYDQGIEDSKQHKSKNKFKFFRAVHPINYLVTPEKPPRALYLGVKEKKKGIISTK